MSAIVDCGFNDSLQHLDSHCREEDVESELYSKKLLLRLAEENGVGSLSEVRVYERYRSSF